MEDALSFLLEDQDNKKEKPADAFSFDADDDDNSASDGGGSDIDEEQQSVENCEKGVNDDNKEEEDSDTEYNPERSKKKTKVQLPKRSMVVLFIYDVLSMGHTERTHKEKCR